MKNGNRDSGSAKIPVTHIINFFQNNKTRWLLFLGKLQTNFAFQAGVYAPALEEKFIHPENHKMAKNLTGIAGAFSGKIGTVVGAMWNGIPTIRSRPNYRRDKPTQKQVIMRERFKLTSKFCRRLAHVFEQNFEPEPGKTKRSSAVGIVARHAITGEYPNLSIDYSKVLVAKGMLKKPSDAVVSSPAPGLLKFNWTHDPVADYYNAEDRAIVVAYLVESEDAICYTDVASRFKGECQLELTLWSGQLVHTWLSFRSLNGSLKADSVYTGTVMIE